MLRKTKSDKKIKLSNSQLIKIGFLLILVGFGFLVFQFVQAEKMKAFAYMNNKLFFSTSDDKIEEDKISYTEAEEPKNQVTNSKKESAPANQENDSYIGILEIPKINLKRGFVDKNSKENNVEKNIAILSASSMPNVKRGNFILAGHSGSGYLAFFNDLYKLKKDDEIFVYYHNIKYTYQIVSIYNEQKTGSINIYRDPKKTVLTLITCTNNNDKEQTVYIANQIKKEKY